MFLLMFDGISLMIVVILFQFKNVRVRAVINATGMVYKKSSIKLTLTGNLTSVVHEDWELGIAMFAASI